MTGPQDQAAPAPCGPDDAVSTVYDAKAYGTCANGHPLNRVGRCPAVNGYTQAQGGPVWTIADTVMVAAP